MRESTPKQQGFNARWFYGMEAHENPYPQPPEHSDPECKSDYWQWHLGWLEAQKKEEPK